MEITFEEILHSARVYQASDIHLIAGLPPTWRINGEIQLAEATPLTKEDLQRIALAPLNEAQRKTLHEEMALCYTLHYDDLGRFRVAIYHRNGSPELAIRTCSEKIFTREELGLPEQIDPFIEKPAGLLLVTGATGSGKTTTLNYLIDQINSRRRCKIVMLEDPIEYVHSHKMALVVQQELHTDVASFNAGLIHILRQDPDVIGIGEMRNYDTIATALTAAETGHLVIATLHTSDITQSVERIISVFPPAQQPQVIHQLANSLVGIVSQRLLPTLNRKGRVLAYELLIMDGAGRNLIRDSEWHQLYTLLEIGRSRGLCTMDSSLARLYETGRISYDSLLSNAKFPDTFRQRYNRSGI